MRLTMFIAILTGFLWTELAGANPPRPPSKMAPDPAVTVDVDTDAEGGYGYGAGGSGGAGGQGGGAEVEAGASAEGHGGGGVGEVIDRSSYKHFSGYLPPQTAAPAVGGHECLVHRPAWGPPVIGVKSGHTEFDAKCMCIKIAMAYFDVGDQVGAARQLDRCDGREPTERTVDPGPAYITREEHTEAMQRMWEAAQTKDVPGTQ